ncbi:MAG: hypothetical protein KDB03_11970 [Planctomycetales bacterium]|nr:hypothetical protein [Planctomycetales bacterium]
MSNSNPRTAVTDGLKLELAKQYAPRKAKAGIRQIALNLQQGGCLESAISSQLQVLPIETAALFRQSLVLNDPAQFLLNAFRQEYACRQVRNRFLLCLLYPACLLIAALVISAFLNGALTSMLGLLTTEFDEFGGSWLQSNLRAQSMVDEQLAIMIGCLGILAWLAVAILLLVLIAPRWAVLAVVGGVPLIGRPLRWLQLYNLLGRMSLLANEGCEGTSATQFLTKSYTGGQLMPVARKLEQRIANGMLLGQALCHSTLADSICAPMLLSLDNSHSPDQLYQTSLVLLDLSKSRIAMLVSLLPFVTLVLVATVIWASIGSYFAVLTFMIQLIDLLTPVVY